MSDNYHQPQFIHTRLQRRHDPLLVVVFLHIQLHIQKHNSIIVGTVHRDGALECSDYSYHIDVIRATIGVARQSTDEKLRVPGAALSPH